MRFAESSAGVIVTAVVSTWGIGCAPLGPLARILSPPAFEAALGGALRRALAGEAIPFRLDGTVSIDAGPLGQPSFGPSTWLRGDLDISGQPRSNSSRIGFPLPSLVTYTGRFSTM